MSESINQSKPQTDHVITLEEFYTIGKPQKVVQDILSGTGEQFVQDSSEYKEAVQSIDMSRTAVLRLTMENAGDIEWCIRAFQSTANLPDDDLMTIATDLLRLRRFDLLQLWFERIVRESPTKFVLVFEMVTTMASVIIQAGESPKKTKNASKDFKSKITELLEEAINSASSTIQDVSVEMCGELYFAYGLFQSEMYQSPKNAKKVLQTALQYWEKRAYRPLALMLRSEDDFEWADALIHEGWENHHSIECLELLMQQDFESGNVPAGLEKWNTIVQHGFHIQPRSALIGRFEFPRDTVIIEAEQLAGDSVYDPFIRGNIMAGLHRATQVTFDKRNQEAEMDYLSALQLGAIELADQSFGKRYIQYLASLVNDDEYGIPFLAEFFKSHASTVALKRYQAARISMMEDWDDGVLYDDEKPETDQSSMDVIRAHVRQAIIDDIVDIDTQNPEGIRHVIEAHIIAVMEYYCSTPDEEAYGAAIGMAKHLKMYELERDLRENQEEINEAMETSETLGEDFIAFCDHMLLWAIGECDGWENYSIFQRKAFFEIFTPTNELGKATLLSLITTLINQQPDRLESLEDYLACLQPEMLNEVENTQLGKLLCFYEFYNEGLPYLMRADLEDSSVFSEILLAVRNSPKSREEFKNWIKKLQAESAGGYPDLIAIAQRHLENTIEIDDQNFLPRAYSMVAQVYEIQDLQEEAMKYYMKASSLDDMHGSEAVALYAMKQGQYDRAQEMFAKLYEWSGWKDVFLMHLIRNDLAGNRRESAAMYLAKLKTENPTEHAGLYLEFAFKGTEDEKLIALGFISRFDHGLIENIPLEIRAKWCVHVDALLPQLHPSIHSTAEELMYTFMVLEVASKLNDNLDFALQYFEILDLLLKNGSKDLTDQVLKWMGDGINMFIDDSGDTFLEMEAVIEYTKLSIFHERANVFVDHFKKRKNLYEFAHMIRKMLKAHFIQTDKAVDLADEWYALAGECIPKTDTFLRVAHLLQSDMEYNPAMLH